MQIQPLTSIPCHYLPRPVSDGRRPFDTRAAALVSSSPPHVLGQKFQPFNYPSPPMSSPPSPPRSYIPTTSASEGQRSSQDVGRGAPAPPHTGSPSTTAFRRETIPASAALLSPGQYPSTTRTLYSPGPPPTLGQGTLLDSAHYFPQRAALSPRTAGVGIVQTEFGRPAAGPLRGGTRSSRRGKTHVQKACINCKKAHLSCDAQRPCARCVASGKQVSLA